MNAANLPIWVRALADPAAFADEQDKLGRVWTLLGLATDVANDGDWFRASLGGRSVFVQRFGDALVGFENICAHRFYPLRTKDKGNGPIRCGFHHWQYDRHGRAVGIPKCVEMYGMTSRELGAQLKPIEVQTCGLLIFGRFTPADGEFGAGQTLEQYLGEAFPIVERMSKPRKPPRYIERTVAANWKLCYHMTLEDYHIVAVHPATFGKSGYLDPEIVKYYRLGRHSAYFYGGKPDSVVKMATEIRDGRYRPDHYRIFQLFPGLHILHINTGGIWHIMISHYVPLASGRSLMRSWYFPASFSAEGQGLLGRLWQRFGAPIVALGIGYYHLKITGEDHAVCEGIQAAAAAGQIDNFPLLASHEERIAWFEEVYAEAMASPPAPLSPKAAEPITLAIRRIKRSDAAEDMRTKTAQAAHG